MAGESVAPPALTLDQVTAAPASGGAAILRGVSLELPRGASAVILGGNGAGKSTLLRVASGLLSPTEGGVFMGGDPVSGFDPARVGLVLEEPRGQFVADTTRGEIEFALQCRAESAAGLAQRVDLALDAADLRRAADRSPLTLSGGEQQRLLLAAARVHAPPLLLLDDPFVHLGEGDAWALWTDLVNGLGAGECHGLLMASHDAEHAAAADLTGIVVDGELVAWGPSGNVLRGEFPSAVHPPLGLELERDLIRGGVDLAPWGAGGPAGPGDSGLTPEALAQRIEAAQC